MSAIRTAVIGFGTAGRVFHAPLLEADPAYELTAIVTSSPERAADARRRHPGARVMPGTDELFAAADEFDLVVIGSPNDTHAPLSRRAVEAGLHVVVDKPVAVTAAQAREVLALARDAGVIATVFQNRRWDGDFLTLRALVESGALGEVHQFDSAFEWWKPALGERWKDLAPHAAGGGILYDLGPHLIDQAILLFGPVESVHAELDRRRSGAVGDDDAFVSLRHASGVRTRLWMNAVAPAPRPRFRALGSHAVAEFRGLDPQEGQLKAGRGPGHDGYGRHDDDRTALVSGPEGDRAVPIEPGDYPAFYRALAESILSGAAVPVDPEDSVRGLELIERAIADAS